MIGIGAGRSRIANFSSLFLKSRIIKCFSGENGLFLSRRNYLKGAFWLAEVHYYGREYAGIKKACFDDPECP
jgi:hypothetical protein